jgi:large subunit ribosomal protein L35
MPKQKTHSGASKRFRITKNGKVIHNKAYKSHLLTKKGKTRKRHLRQKGLISKKEAHKIKLMLPYS